MSYYTFKKQIKETVENKTVAIASYQEGAEIIVKALNWYFGDTHSRNQSVEMMHTNTANALKSIAEMVLKWNYTGEQIIDYLVEIADEMEAQALVVSIRDELKFDKPTEK